MKHSLSKRKFSSILREKNRNTSYTKDTNQYLMVRKISPKRLSDLVLRHFDICIKKSYFYPSCKIVTLQKFIILIWACHRSMKQYSNESALNFQ